jgi:hypothetical protein
LNNSRLRRLWVGLRRTAVTFVRTLSGLSTGLTSLCTTMFVAADRST